MSPEVTFSVIVKTTAGVDKESVHTPHGSSVNLQSDFFFVQFWLSMEGLDLGMWDKWLRIFLQASLKSHKVAELTAKNCQQGGEG